MATKVTRKLTFYAWEDAAERHPFDRLAAATAVDSLADDERVLEDDGKLYAVTLSQEGDASEPSRFRLFRLRDHENRPVLFKPGSTPKAVDHALDEYTSDVTHLSIWADGYAAYDAHGNAPGPVRLGRYLREKCDEKAAFTALFNRDVIDRLKELDHLTLLELSISRSEKAQRAIDADKPLFRGLIGLLQSGTDGLSFGTRLSAGRGVGKALDPQIKEDIIDLAPQAEQFFDSIRIVGYKGRGKDRERVAINLLKERLHKEVSLPRASTGGDWPDSAKCFAALSKAKTQLKRSGELENAVRAGT